MSLSQKNVPAVRHKRWGVESSKKNSILNVEPPDRLQDTTHHHADSGGLKTKRKFKTSQLFSRLHSHISVKSCNN